MRAEAAADREIRNRSSRTRHNTDVYRRAHNLKVLLYKALAKIPDEQLSDEDRSLKASLCNMPEIAILHLIYQQKAYEGDAKDHEFSGTSMREHWTSGYEDTKRTLKRRDWIKMPDEGMGLVVHDVHRETESVRGAHVPDAQRRIVKRTLRCVRARDCPQV